MVKSTLLNPVDGLKPGTELDDATAINAYVRAGAVFVQSSLLPTLDFITGKFYKKGDSTGATLAILSSIAKQLLETPSGGDSSKTVTYVCAENGSDTTGQRGNVSKPFATIQAAINACTYGDTIEISPGAYASFTVPTGSIFTFIGKGDPAGSCVMVLGNNSYALNMVLSGADFVSFSNIVFYNTAASLPPVFISKSGNAGLDSVVFKDCAFSPSSYAYGAVFSNVHTLELESNTGNLSVTDCGSLTNTLHKSGKLLLAVSAVPPTGLVQNTTILKTCNFSTGLTISGNVNALTIGRTKALSFTALAVNPNSVFKLNLDVGSVSISAASGSPSIDLSGSKINDIFCQSTSSADITIKANECGIINAITLDSSVGNLVLELFGSRYDTLNCILNDKSFFDRDFGKSYALTIPTGSTRYNFANIGTADYPDFAFPPGVEVICMIQPKVAPTLATNALTIPTSDNEGFDVVNSFSTDTDAVIMIKRGLEWTFNSG